MTGWIERAKQKISETGKCPTAVTAERDLTSVLAVLNPGKFAILHSSNVSNGSIQPGDFREIEQQNTDPVPSENLLQTPRQRTANAAERTLSRIREWLRSLDETDATIIAETLDRCKNDPEVFNYFIYRAKDVVPGDRITCTQCSNLLPGGRCLSAQRDELRTSRNYRPTVDTPMRCIGYQPNENDPDQRNGRERWPSLAPKIQPHV